MEQPKELGADVVHVKSDFEMYVNQGPYSNLGQVCQKIGKEPPGCQICYNLYLDDSEKTKPEDGRTEIYFRS